MKKIIILVLVAAFATYLLAGNYSVNQVKLDSEGNYVSKYAWISSDEWNSIDSSNSKYSAPEELLLEIDYYVEEIAERINRNEWLNELKLQSKEDFKARIEVKFTYDSFSRANGGGSLRTDTYIKPSIKMNRERFENNRDEIAHELTHVISPFSDSLSFNEGLACYIQDTISLSNPSFKIDLELIESKYIDNEYEYIFDYLGSSSNGSNKFYSSIRLEQLLFYAFSDSFTHYLVSEYGMEKYLEMYTSEFDHDTYVQLFGIDRDQLILNWKKSISSVD